MIRNVTGYGVVLTREFGNPLKGYEKLVYLIHEHYRYQVWQNSYSKDPEYAEYNPEEEYDYMGNMLYSSWVFTCPSSGEWQIALGFETFISKKTDFKELDKQFAKVIQNLPEDIAQEVKNLGLDGSEVADIVELSGKC